MITRAELADYLGVVFTPAEEVQVDFILSAVREEIIRYLQYDPYYATTTEYHPQGEAPRWDMLLRIPPRRNMSSSLVLRRLPVHLAGLRVWTDREGRAGQAVNPFLTELTLGVDFYLDVENDADGLSWSGMMYHNRAWPTTPRSVRVEYAGGLRPGDPRYPLLQVAAMSSAASMFKQRTTRQQITGEIQSESIGKYSYSRALDANAAMGTFGGSLSPILTADARLALQSLRNFGRYLV